MAATTAFFTTSSIVVYGRSGYNKGDKGDDDNGEDAGESKLRNYGRSGYNKGDKGDDDDEN